MNRARKIVFWCAVVVAAVAAVYVAVRLFSQDRNAQVYEDLPGQATASPPALGSAPGSETGAPTEQPYVSPIDFEALWEINEDIYAWLEIPGMDIAYPIVRHPTDDAYYLNHTIEGNRGLPGSIYTESSANSGDFTDFNTVIYGHNAGQGRMFSNLLNYRDASVLDANRDIVIYTPEAAFHYKIFAAVMFGDEYLPYFYPGDTVGSRQAYLDALANVRDLNSHVLDDVEVTPEDRIITLSTCPDSVRQEPKRYLVAAVLEEELHAAEDAGA